MSLFIRNHFFMHSGEPTDFKIECDALTDEDFETIAFLINKRVKFSEVYGIPSGGEKLAKALEQYVSDGPLLIVDDVLSTGGSFRAARSSLAKKNKDMIGICIFCRSPKQKPEWVQSLFDMWDF